SLPLIGQAPMPAADHPLPAGMKTAIGNFVQKNQPAITLLQRGAKLSGSRYPLDLTRGIVLLPHVAKVKQSAQLSALFALSQAEARQGNAAGEAVLMTLSLAQSLDPE